MKVKSLKIAFPVQSPSPRSGGFFLYNYNENSAKFRNEWNSRIYAVAHDLLVGQEKQAVRVRFNSKHFNVKVNTIAYQTQSFYRIDNEPRECWEMRCLSWQVDGNDRRALVPV